MISLQQRNSVAHFFQQVKFYSQNSIHAFFSHHWRLMGHTCITTELYKWLPIEARISYKLCSLMYRVARGSAPTYLTELCQPCSDTRLRSTSCSDFIVPRSNRQLSNSSFSVAAPSAWNRLPLHIRISPTSILQTQDSSLR